MKLCVLMPVFNEAKFIRSAIASITVSRPELDVEIIIVDDGSTDSTVDVIENITKTTPDIRLIRTENRGVASARNTLLAAIPESCDLVTFLDGDDAFEAGHLEKACKTMREDPTLELFYSQLCTVESDRQNMADEPRETSLISRTISMSIGVYRPALLAKIGKFDLTFEQAEDFDYIMRLFETHPVVHLDDEIAVLYRQHSGNVTAAKKMARRFCARAVMGHIRRRKADPSLATMEGVFSISQLGNIAAQRS